jgi:hypothetical protein
MTLNTKLAFEIWAGIVLLIIVVGGIAGATLMFGNDVTPLLQTQVNNPTPTPSATPFLSDSAIQSASQGVSQALLGGTQP